MIITVIKNYFEICPIKQELWQQIITHQQVNENMYNKAEKSYCKRQTNIKWNSMRNVPQFFFRENAKDLRFISLKR
jgi:hypothetical protein